MPVSDHVVEMLRAELSGNPDRYKELLHTSYDRAADARSYIALVNCAFMSAAERRFGASATQDDVTEFVAEVRSRNDDTATLLDPVTAERVLLTAVSDGNIAGLDPQAVRESQLFLLAALVSDENLDGPALDALLAVAREEADAHLARIAGRA
jgi:hypothetical protein